MPNYNNQGGIKSIDELLAILWLIKLSRCECIVSGKEKEE